MPVLAVPIEGVRALPRAVSGCTVPVRGLSTAPVTLCAAHVLRQLTLLQIRSRHLHCSTGEACSGTSKTDRSCETSSVEEHALYKGLEHVLCLPRFAKDMNTPCSLSDALEPGDDPSPSLAAAPVSSLAAGALCGLTGTEKACTASGEAPAAVPA